MPTVERCICYDISFAELKAIADRTGADLETLSAKTGCCTGCGMCRPYVELMLKTGRTSFPLLPIAQLRKLDQPES